MVSTHNIYLTFEDYLQYLDTTTIRFETIFIAFVAL